MSESNTPPPEPNPYDPAPPPASQPPPPPPDPEGFDSGPPPVSSSESDAFGTAPPPGATDSYDTAPPIAPPPPNPAAYSPPRPDLNAQPLPYEGVQGYPGPYIGPAPDKDSKTMAMLAHLLSIFTGFLGPLVIWLLKKDTSPFVDDQGKESLNFQLVALIGYVIGFATSFLCIGLLIFPVVWVLSVIFAVMGTIQANNGVAYRYPINIRFIK